jgi:hypothetical protein
MPVMPSEPVKHVDGSDNDYEAESALEDLMRAEKHKGNKELMKRVVKRAEEKSGKIRSIADLKAAYNDEAKE